MWPTVRKGAGSWGARSVQHLQRLDQKSDFRGREVLSPALNFKPWRKRGHHVPSFRKRLPVQLVWRRSERQQTTARHWPIASLGRRCIKAATFNLGDLAETDRTCATGAPYCLPFVSLICVPSRGAVVGIEWGNRDDAAGDIEDLASELYCVRADRDFVCRDSSDRGIAPERRNAECESC